MGYIGQRTTPFYQSPNLERGQRGTRRRMMDTETETERQEAGNTPTDTFIDEAQSFIGRHRLENQQATFGGLAWGLLRAVLECDHCPGKFRVPLGEDLKQLSPFGKEEWRHLYCTNCKGLWTKAEGKA